MSEPDGGQPPLRRPRTNRTRSTHRPEAGASGAAGKSATGGVAVPAARPAVTPPSGMTGSLRLLLTPMTGTLKLNRGNADDLTGLKLRVDWPQCKAHGLCADLAPGVIHLDEWGYPFIDSGPLVAGDVAAVRKAVTACPTLALKLVDEPPR